MVADAVDLATIGALLEQASLPVEGLGDQFPSAYVLACGGPEILGAAGLEVYGTSGLLRSVVVAEHARGGGIGNALVADRLARARKLGIERVFVLTTTAASYFERLGFRATPRSEVPPSLSACPEFARACPASAACLARAP